MSGVVSLCGSPQVHRNLKPTSGNSWRREPEYVREGLRISAPVERKSQHGAAPVRSIAWPPSTPCGWNNVLLGIGHNHGAPVACDSRSWSAGVFGGWLYGMDHDC